MAELEPRGIEVVIAGRAGRLRWPASSPRTSCCPSSASRCPGGALDGHDALFGLTQLPPGVPVAAVGIDNALNAAVLAVQMLAVGDRSCASGCGASRTTSRRQRPLAEAGSGRTGRFHPLKEST